MSFYLETSGGLDPNLYLNALHFLHPILFTIIFKSSKNDYVVKSCQYFNSHRHSLSLSLSYENALLHSGFQNHMFQNYFFRFSTFTMLLSPQAKYYI
jgi:hypothetical protein